MARFLFFLLVIFQFTSGFVPKPLLATPKAQGRHCPQQSNLSTKPSSTTKLLMIRGGDIAPAIIGSLQSGPFGVLGLWAVASAVVVPCTIYRQGFSFSVGYGYSVMAMAAILGKVFGFSPLVMAAAFYGCRLGSYLLLRNLISEEKAKQTKAFDKTPRLKRIPFAASVALFYSFLMTPALYAMRFAFAGSDNVALLAGTVIAWTGALLEAIADTQKLAVKIKSNNEDGFVGPTSGVYRLTRHPNYTGEVVFWLGLFVSGVPALGKSIVGWACSVLGFYGIYSIMTSATKRLDAKQLENYGGQDKYDEWRKGVKAPIFPLLNVE